MIMCDALYATAVQLDLIVYIRFWPIIIVYSIANTTYFLYFTSEVYKIEKIELNLNKKFIVNN